MFHIFNTSKEKKIFNLLYKKLFQYGFIIARIRFVYINRKSTCQILIKKNNCNFTTLHNCATFSRISTNILKLKSSFFYLHDLEISSCGVNKPLTTLRDFIKNIGNNVKLFTIIKIQNSRIFFGILKSVDINDRSIILSINKNKIIKIRFIFIADISLNF